MLYYAVLLYCYQLYRVEDVCYPGKYMCILNLIYGGVMYVLYVSWKMCMCHGRCVGVMEDISIRVYMCVCMYWAPGMYILFTHFLPSLSLSILSSYMYILYVYDPRPHMYVFFKCVLLSTYIQ